MYDICKSYYQDAKKHFNRCKLFKPTISGKNVSREFFKFDGATTNPHENVLAKLLILAKACDFRRHFYYFLCSLIMSTLKQFFFNPRKPDRMGTLFMLENIILEQHKE